MIKLYLSESKEQPSVLNFFQWTVDTKNITLRALPQLFMGFGLGIYIQRVNDRNNDVIVSNTCFSHSNVPYTERLNIAN